ncbi:MAG: D-alanyl-D-alanine carboxypeptidase/D-alanyl-D-alanine-endopeptidase [Prevotellaceae bacterium]|nr:D-alanyl-D-alanine carboxypeptidase/D-alanyl-D-alanine-endopeptidase [Prevotellaceae bacterium]
MKRFLLLLALCLSCAGFTFAQDLPDATRKYASRLDSIVARQLPAASHAGICIYDLTAGETLYAYQADKLSHPASTMKLLTAVTALDGPEADAPFRTEVWYKGYVECDTLRGDLYVVGGFDPEFDDAALDTLATLVARLPFKAIQGKLYGDVSMKDSLYWGSGWLWDDTPDAFQPYLSPLMLAKGAVTVKAVPAEAGKQARLTAVPTSSYYTLINKTVSRTPSAGGFKVTRNWLENGNKVTVSGNVDAARAGAVNIYPSQDFFMQTLVDRLEGRGVSCPKGYGFKELTDKSSAVWVGEHATPVDAVLKKMLKESENVNAEAMLCRLGVQTTGKKHVSAKEGLDAVRRLITTLGYNPKHYRIADGCGLSNYNYISPELLVAFLRYAWSKPGIYRQIYKALPVAGIDGTLKNRMKGGSAGCRNVHAKTGSFTGINCLAGYMKLKNGHLAAFAIMNQDVLQSKEARAFQDAVCEAAITLTGE